MSSTYLWDRYRAGQQLDIFFSLSQVTVPEVFAKNNSKHLYSVDLTGSYNFCLNHNYNKIVKSDWLSTALISALIGKFNKTVRVMPK